MELQKLWVFDFKPKCTKPNFYLAKILAMVSRAHALANVGKKNKLK